MLTISLEVLDRGLENYYQTHLRKKTESLQTQVSDSPTQLPGRYPKDLTRLILKDRRRRTLVALAIMSWYMTEEVRFILQLELKELSFKEVDFELMEILLNSKAYSLGWLLENEWWNEFDLFGNVLTRELAQSWERVDFPAISTRKVKRYSGYCRGYRDSSRRAPSPLPGELLARSSVTKEIQRDLNRQLLTAIWIDRIERRLRIVA